MKGSNEAVGLTGAGQNLAEALKPLTENVKGIEKIFNDLEERVKKLEKKSWWKFW